MVAFSRITLALTIAGVSSAQSFSGPAASGLPSDFPYPSVPAGAARPTGGFGGHHGHGGHHSGSAQPTGGFHAGGPRPSGTAVFGAQRAYQSGEAPFPSAGDFSSLPSGVAKPSGHHGHHGHHGKGGKGEHHSGQASGAAPTVTPSVLQRRFPAPSGGFPSGGFPESGAPFPSGADFPSFLSGVAKPTGHHGHHGHGGKGSKSHAGPRPTGLPASGEPSGPAPTGFVTSTVRGA